MNTKHDARKLDLIGKEQLRCRVVQSVIVQGMSKAGAARIFGVSRTSVHPWIALYERNGEDGLTPKRPRRPEGGGRLKGWQAATIVNLIKDNCPEQL